jgi:hypothetical protein
MNSTVITTAFTLDPLLAWIAAACIAVLLAHAAVSKLADRSLFEQHLAAYRVPAILLPALVWAVPLTEALAAALLLSPWRGAGALLAAGLLLGYGALMAWHRAHGHRLECGCGGDALPVSWALVARNTVLAAMAALAGTTVTARPTGGADFAVVAGAVVLGALLYAALHQVLRLRAGPASRHAFGRV